MRKSKVKLSRDISGEIIFWATVVLGLALYFVSAPSGLPWSGSTKMALAWSGTIEELPQMPDRVWGYFIQVFGGHFVALSAVAAAVAGGLIGAIANRYLGWRVGTAAAIVWIFFPPVWDRAILGTHGMFWTFGVVVTVWVANAVFLIVTRRARKTVAAQGNAAATLQDSTSWTWRMWVNRIAAWVMLAASVLFAVVSASRHDYMIGEVASAYARVMLDEIGERTAVLGGVADDQMIWEAERREAGSSARLVVLRNDDAYRTQFVARVRREWPGETNLWVAAQVGPETFANLAVARHPERFYVMTGVSTTPEKWARRWEAMKGYRTSRDPFLPVMCRAFAFEANTLGNRLQTEGKLKEAWKLYANIVDEVDPYNVSACVNLSEMMRRGYAADEQRRKRIETRMANLYKNLSKGRAAERAAAIVAMCGPVMPDSKVMAEYRAGIANRMAELAKERERDPAKANQEWQMPSELKSLVEWNDEMLKAHDRGDLAEAARIARTILSKREWQSFIPANAVMGSVMAVEGDYVSSEVFYSACVAGKEKPPPAVCNDYADTLIHLGRLDEAERYARMAVGQAPKTWLFKLTLAEVLLAAKKDSDEMRALVREASRSMPEERRKKLAKEFGL